MAYLFDFLKPMHIHILTPEGWTHIYDVLDPPNPFEIDLRQGDSRSDRKNLDYPYRILNLSYEDMPIADNYDDLRLRVNPVACPTRPLEWGHMIVTFNCEGSYEKIVCYQGRMIHHYEPDELEMGRRNHYGIFASWDLPLKGNCPFCSIAW